MIIVFGECDREIQMFRDERRLIELEDAGEQKRVAFR